MVEIGSLEALMGLLQLGALSPGAMGMGAQASTFTDQWAQPRPGVGAWETTVAG